MTVRPAKMVLWLWVLGLSSVLVAQEKKGSDEHAPNVPIEQWLRGPERNDFKWRVQLLSPRRTFQQRNLVQVRAYLDAEPLSGDDHHDFYFILKVADEKGNWLPDDMYNHYPLPPGIDKKNEIQYSSGFYAKPGKYTVGLVLYDVENGKGNVWRKEFEVKPPKKNLLPQLDRDVPAIEFINEVPSDALPTHETVVIGRPRGGLGPLINFGTPRYLSDQEWPPAHGVEVLPVRAARPLRVDVILNVAPHIDPYLQRRNGAAEYRSVTGRMLQIGALLSHLGVDRGCVRVSAVDLSKLSVVFDRIDGRTADWDKITEQVRKIDRNTISVDVLSKRKSTAGFLRDYATRIMTDESGCGPGNEKTERALILVSHDFQFPSGTRGDHLWPDIQCACRYYYLRIHSIGSDDLDKFMKPANPRRLDAEDPDQFRKVLAELIDDLSGGRARAREVAP